MLTTHPITLQPCVAGHSRVVGPAVLLDGQFLDLVDRKIRARSTSAMETTITKPKLRRLFGSLWENKIKPLFDGFSTDFHQDVRSHPGDAGLTIEFTAYAIQIPYSPSPAPPRCTRIWKVLF